MTDICPHLVISDRRTSGVNHGDLLDLMLTGKDPVTDKGLQEENIRYQVWFFNIPTIGRTD